MNQEKTLISIQRTTSNEQRFEFSCDEVGDVIAAASLLIIAGAKNNDPESIEAGIQKWNQVWDPKVVEIHAELLIKSLADEQESTDF